MHKGGAQCCGIAVSKCPLRPDTVEEVPVLTSFGTWPDFIPPLISFIVLMTPTGGYRASTSGRPKDADQSVRKRTRFIRSR